MQDRVAEHDARFRAVIEANDGYVVKGRGDGFHAAFARASDAVAAAEAAQAALVDLPEILVGMALNTGEVQERDGDSSRSPRSMPRLPADRNVEVCVVEPATGGRPGFTRSGDLVTCPDHPL